MGSIQRCAKVPDLGEGLGLPSIPQTASQEEMALRDQWEIRNHQGMYNTISEWLGGAQPSSYTWKAEIGGPRVQAQRGYMIRH